MPLLFSILNHYNLLRKQPNYTCGLFFFDLMFMVMSWARTSMSISKKAWTFPGRPYYYILYFQNLIESPTRVRQKEERDIMGPRENLEGEELPCRFLSRLGGSRGDILGPQGIPVWGRAALQVPLSSRDLVMVWAHPGNSWQSIFKIVLFMVFFLFESCEFLHIFWIFARYLFGLQILSPIP